MTPISNQDIQEAGLHNTGTTAVAFKRRVIFAIAAGWSSKGVSIIVNLIQIPLLFRYLDDEILGIWFLMIGAQMFIGLFDFGFGQTLQRRIAFAKGTCGSDPDVVLDHTARQKIRDLLAIARRVYNILSGVVLLVLLIGGPIYFRTLELSVSATRSLDIAWIIMSIGYAANMWGWFVEATLNGLGDIGWSNIISSMLWITTLAAIWIALVMGWGLPALAFIWVSKGVLLRVIGWMVVRRRHAWIGKGQGSWIKSEFQAMVRPAVQWWIAIVGTFFLSGISRYFIGGYLGASAVPDYVATFAALAMAQAVLISIVGVTTPLLSQMWQAGDLESIRKYVFRLTRLSLGLLAMVYAFICIYGKEIFELWLGEGHFVGNPVLFTLVIMMFLEAQHAVLNAPCIAAERLQFYKYTILGGFISLALLALMVPRWGLLGAALSVMIAQLLTNNWVIPWISLNLLHESFQHYFVKVILPVLALGVFIVSIGLITSHVLSGKLEGVMIHSLVVGITSALLLKQVGFVRKGIVGNNPTR